VYMYNRLPRWQLDSMCSWQMSVLPDNYTYITSNDCVIYMKPSASLYWWHYRSQWSSGSMTDCGVRGLRDWIRPSAVMSHHAYAYLSTFLMSNGQHGTYYTSVHSLHRINVKTLLVHTVFGPSCQLSITKGKVQQCFLSSSNNTTYLNFLLEAVFFIITDNFCLLKNNTILT